MELAHRIKAARLAAGLSQRQLCGDAVSRNMLSLIESGKARPSMDTLRHFAQTLGKPLSYFLDEDGAASTNQKRMRDAENAYCRKAFTDVLALLEEYEAPDPVFDNVRYLLEYLTCLELAQTALADGKRHYVAALLERAENARVNTIYAPDRQRAQLLRYRLDPGTAGQLELSADLLLQAKAEAALCAHDPAAAITCLTAMDNLTDRGHLLWGKAALAMEDYETARAHLLLAQHQHPTEAIPLLEQVFLALGDYKSAYEYAKKH